MYTKQDGIEAMNNLIANTKYTEADFTFSDELDVEIGYELGTPLLKTTDDDFIVSAYEHWLGWLQMQDPNADDDYIDYNIENGLI